MAPNRNKPQTRLACRSSLENTNLAAVLTFCSTGAFLEKEAQRLRGGPVKTEGEAPAVSVRSVENHMNVMESHQEKEKKMDHGETGVAFRELCVCRAPQ